MRVKNLTDDQILARQVEAKAKVKAKVTLLKRPTTNNLTDYFTNSQYLDNPASPKQGKIQTNVQVHRHRLVQQQQLRLAQQHKIVRQHQMVLYTEPDNKNKLENMNLGIIILVLVLSVGTYGLLSNMSSPQAAKSSMFTPDAQSTSKTSIKEQLIASRAETPTKNYLQSMAMSIMQDSDWDIQKVHYFKRSWENLESEQQSEAKNSIWYQLFENALLRELFSYAESPDSYGYETAVRERALLALTDSLSIRQKLLLPPIVDSAKPDVIPKNDIPPVAVIAAADHNGDNNGNGTEPTQHNLKFTPRANSDAVAGTSARPTDATTTNAMTTNAMATYAMAPKVSRSAEQSDNATVAENSQAVKPVQIASLGVLKPLPPARNTAPASGLKSKRRLSSKPTKNTSKPTEKELDTIEAQFVNSYELGDIKQFVSLFSDDVISNSYNDIDGLKNQYSELFRKTAKRHMILHNIKWKFRKDKAIGKAKMELRLVSTSGTQAKTQFGRLQLVAEKQQDKIVISRIYVLTD